MTTSFADLNAECGVCHGNPEVCVSESDFGAQCTQLTSAVIAATPAAQAERVYPEYRLMVERLFKIMPGNNHEALLHAVIGMSGETAELMASRDKDNTIEECGDLEFYVEAACQRLPAMSVTMSDVQQVTESARQRALQFNGNLTQALSVIAGDILDLVKKSWVYGKALDLGKMTILIVEFELVLAAFYLDMDVTRKMIRHANQVKLIGPGGRFESGFYTDAAAIARADKVAEDVPVGNSSMERRFFGKSN
jgi:hypothetical protein